MARIKGRDTAPERQVRSMIHAMGVRFRLHPYGLPGKPDLVLTSRKLVVFVHGCFWHRHRGCKFAYTPKTRIEFWSRKFARNVARDEEVKKLLRKLGWKHLTVWECELTKPDRVHRRLNKALFD